MDSSDQRYIDRVILKYRDYEDSGLFPDSLRLRANSWINNFQEADKVFAAALLDLFVCFSDKATDSLLEKSIQLVLNTYIGKDYDYHSRRSKVKDFIAKACWTRIDGEDPNPSDSGNIFCRKIRYQIGIQEERIKTPANAIIEVIKGNPVVLIDDFCGSGEQVIKTIKRSYNGISLYDAWKKSNGSIYLSVLAITEFAENRLQSLFPQLRICGTHRLTSKDHIKSKQVPRECPKRINISNLLDFLSRYSNNLDVPTYIDNPENRKYGFNNLGLTIAFQHSIPDSSLPIFWASGDQSWNPLKERK